MCMCACICVCVCIYIYIYIYAYMYARKHASCNNNLTILVACSHTHTVTRVFSMLVTKFRECYALDIYCMDCIEFGPPWTKKIVESWTCWKEKVHVCFLDVIKTFGHAHMDTLTACIFLFAFRIALLYGYAAHNMVTGARDSYRAMFWSTKFDK